jgi:CRP/FNR family transcriptional activator FtrB
VPVTASEIASARHLPLFSGLGEAEMGRVLSRAAVQVLPPGSLLFEQGDRPEFLHLLIDGVVELFKRSGRRECGLMLLAGGDVFMPAAVLFDEVYLNSARALTQVRLLLVRADVARREFEGCHRFATNVSRVLAGHVRMATRHIIDLKCRSAPQRLAHFLLRIVDAGGARSVADLPVQKRHLAHRVGITPETLSRNLQTLAEHGLLVRGTRIHVRDRARIDRFCGPPPYPDPAEGRLDVHIL